MINFIIKNFTPLSHETQKRLKKCISNAKKSRTRFIFANFSNSPLPTFSMSVEQTKKKSDSNESENRVRLHIVGEFESR